MGDEKKRVRRSKDQIVAEKIAVLNNKIADYQRKIAKCEAEKEAILNPQLEVSDITSKINELNLPLDEVMKAVDRIAKKQQKQEAQDVQGDS